MDFLFAMEAVGYSIYMYHADALPIFFPFTMIVIVQGEYGRAMVTIVSHHVSCSVGGYLCNSVFFLLR
jgi:hypothetical protein